MDVGLSINSLAVSAEDKTIIEIESVHLPKTGIVALLGPSGCGKSSLLCAISELYQPSLQYSRDISHVLDNVSYGMVWQIPTVFPCEVMDNLKIPLKKRGVNKKLWKSEAEAVLRETGLLEELGKNWMSVKADVLSGGQKQRLSIAMGMLKKCDIYLFDEPTSALDPASTKKVELIIEKLAETSLVVLVTHSIGQARRIAHYCMICCIQNGRGIMCEYGNTKSVLHAPEAEETKEFIYQEIGIIEECV